MEYITAKIEASYLFTIFIHTYTNETFPTIPHTCIDSFLLLLFKNQNQPNKQTKIQTREYIQHESLKLHLPHIERKSFKVITITLGNRRPYTEKQQTHSILKTHTQK